MKDKATKSTKTYIFFWFVFFSLLCLTCGIMGTVLGSYISLYLYPESYQSCMCLTSFLVFKLISFTGLMFFGAGLGTILFFGWMNEMKEKYMEKRRYYETTDR
jgi:hypothetical protein